MRVLVAIDDDPLLEDVLGALRWCVRIQPSDSVTVLHAVKPSWLPHVDELSAAGRPRDERAERLLADAVTTLSRWGVHAEPRHIRGTPGEEILGLARGQGADLVVLGALGWQHHGFLVGSVTHKVNALSSADVLAVRRGAPFADTPLRVVLAVDGSAESLAAARSVATKIRPATVHVVHVLDMPVRSAWEAFEHEGALDTKGLPELYRTEAEAALEPALRVLKEHGIEGHPEVRRGKPAHGILRAADEHRAHVVALGSRGRSGLRGLLLGSVAERVLNLGITSTLIAHGA